jgi:hypothetical protein
LTNFDEEGRETSLCSNRAHANQTSSMPDDRDNPSLEDKYIKRTKLLQYSDDNRSNQIYNKNANFAAIEDSDPVRVLWERLCQVTQRLVIAKAANDKLADIFKRSPDNEKKRLIDSLKEEVVLLNIVKTQLEEAVSNAVAEGLLSMGSNTSNSAKRGRDSANNNPSSEVDNNNEDNDGSAIFRETLPSFSVTFDSSDSSS